MNVPPDLLYAKSHEWIRLDGNVATVGVTDHAQAELTDVVFVELPGLGRQVLAGEAAAVVESVKAASDIYSPLAGEIIETNLLLESDPAKVNLDPYGEGWIFKLRLPDGAATTAEATGLMTAADYQAFIS